jgi:cell shape-determining protein MreC
MKKHFSQPKMSSLSRRRTAAPIGILVALLAILGIIGADMFSDGFVRGSMRSGAALVWQGFSGAQDTLASLNILRSRRELNEEIERLRTDVSLLRARAFEYMVLEAENMQLRDQLALSDAYPDGQTARVLSPFSVSPFGTVVVSLGVENGVKEGDYVVAPGEIAIGYVADAQERTSLVHLFFGPDVEVSAVVGTLAAAVVHGRGSNTGVIELPRGVPVAEGDPVHLAGAPFLIGVVGKVEVYPSGAVQTLYVRAPVVFDSLRFVRIVPAF